MRKGMEMRPTLIIDGVQREEKRRYIAEKENMKIFILRTNLYMYNDWDK